MTFSRIGYSVFIFGLLLFSGVVSFGQGVRRDFNAPAGSTIEIVNLSGRVDVTVRPLPAGEISVAFDPSATISAVSNEPIAESELKIQAASGRIQIEVAPSGDRKRIDLSLIVPDRSRVDIETGEGEVRLSGNFDSAAVKTLTGTIATDVPVDEIKYKLLWTASRPRFLSDFEIEKVKERSGGKFEIKGTYVADEAKPAKKNGRTERDYPAADEDPQVDVKDKGKKNKAVSKVVSLNFTTDRGIVLLNVPPNEVSSDLRERPLTNAAKAIIRSGDTYLMDAIRRASPKYFGDYARTLPPARRQPVLSVRTAESDSPPASIKRATVHVTDAFNRAVPGLAAPDFSVTENGAEREIVKLETTNAPFNLVLLLDVSGSVDNYVNFIRKAARSFVDTVDRRDRVSIVLFNDDVKVLSKFTTDKGRLSESLDTFDAGGATAYYDALAYTLADTLRPLKGERTAIVILTDGDDNRSFLSFDGIIGAIEESGALIYPLYVPSALIASSSNGQLDNVDPLRARYMTLTSKAEGEGAKLAAISGGIYYPISQLSQIQTAYDDIVVQLRSAYVLTFRSQAASGETRPSLRLKVKVNKPNTFTSVGPIVRLN